MGDVVSVLLNYRNNIEIALCLRILYLMDADYLIMNETIENLEKN